MNYARWVWLAVLSVVAVGAVIGIQLAAGGGRYEPTTPPSACTDRVPEEAAATVEQLSEQLVLVGVANAACDLGISREALVLELAQSSTPTTEQVDALRAGLVAAVDELDAAGTLPKASELRDEVLERADLNPLVAGALRLLPASVVDTALPTDEVLTRAIADLDVRALLTDLDNADQLNAEVERAVTDAAQDTFLSQLSTLLPG